MSDLAGCLSRGREQTAHPKANFFRAGFRGAPRWRQATFGYHYDAIAHLEELLELFGYHEYGDAVVAQIYKRLAYRRGGTDVKTPSGLRSDQCVGLLQQLPTDDELLEIASRKAGRGCVRATATNIMVFYASLSETSSFWAVYEAEA